MKRKIKEEVIKYLPFPDCVRKRPNLYIGDTEDASVLLREIIDNSTDEVSVYGNTIFISPDFNGYCVVSDNGRGLPISLTTIPGKEGITQAELSITELHSGSKFDSDNIDESGNVISRTGLHGLGSSAVSALSTDYIILSIITKDNYNRSIPAVRKAWMESADKKNLYYVLKTSKGVKVEESAGHIDLIEKNIINKGISNYRRIPRGSSTIVLFKPDPTIFDSVKTRVPLVNLNNYITIQEKFYNKKVNIYVDDEEVQKLFKPYQFEFISKIYPKDSQTNKVVDIYVTFEADPKLKNSEGGSVGGLEVNQGVHLNYTQAAYKSALKKCFGIKHEYILNGLNIFVILLASEVSYDSQTKVRLKKIDKVKPSDFLTSLEPCFIEIFRRNREYWEEHVNRLDLLAESMKNISAIDKTKKMIESGSGVELYRSKNNLVKGFVDATCPDRTKCTLFICEGLSPGSSLVNARIDNTAAVLPLRGKTLSSQNRTLDRVLENKEIYSIFSAIKLGVDDENVTKGCKTREEAFNKIMRHTRYSKICISTDPDPDGYFIANSLIYTFCKFAKFMIYYGLLYVVEVPVYIQTINGVEKFYYPSDPVIPETILPVGMDLSKPYSHIKGLGSLTKSQTQKAFYDVNTRRLIRITPENMLRSTSLTDDINERKKFLINCGILSNPYNFKD